MAILSLTRWLTAQAIVLGVLNVSFASDLPEGKYTEWTQDRDVFVPMRDGLHMSTTVVRPKGVSGKLPAVLVRSPYDDTSKLFGAWLWLDDYVKHGYAVVLQDQRGRGFSEGTQKDLLQGAGQDGADTVAWITQQSWSNGKVGAIGCSVSGMEQWPLARLNPQGFAAMIPIAAGPALGKLPNNDTRAGFYRGGVPRISMFGSWFPLAATNERLVLPANSTQEQRIRLRNSYSSGMLWAKDVLHHTGAPDVSLYAHLPSREIVSQFGGALTPFEDYITWTPGDGRWDRVEVINTGAQPRVPALHVNTWHDHSAGETARLFEYLQDQGTPNQYLIIGPGWHCSQADNTDEQWSTVKVGDLDAADGRYGGAEHSYAKLFLNWFDHWLGEAQNHVTDMPKVQLFVMNQGWLFSDRWPIKNTHFTSYYLDGTAGAGGSKESTTLSLQPPSADDADRYVYDPGQPTPSLGGGAWEEATPARDQRPVEARADVLTYSTTPLSKPLVVAGPIEVTLYVASSAKDTDFTVKLVDVYPDGRAINLDDDAFRVRYRDGFDKTVLMQPGQVYKIVLPNMVTANRFEKGHRIRLDIASSNFPEYERNLNTGGNNYDETAWVVAENEVHHARGYPSKIVLPVLPDR